MFLRGPPDYQKIRSDPPTLLITYEKYSSVFVGYSMRVVTETMM
jgi:hypothetical protein